MKNFVEYVTCDCCGNRYAGKIPPGGDGTALMPRKHYAHRTLLGKQYGVKCVCPGSYKLAREFTPMLRSE